MKFLNQLIRVAGAFLLIVLSSNQVKAHCEIPCGIYGDSLRVALLYEHITTVEKSMVKINELSEVKDKDYHMIMRWVVNKEEHAKKIQDIVSQYFLHQRVKIKDMSDTDAYNKYIEQLTLMHKLMVYAMKSKQTIDIKYTQKMQETLHSFEHSYFGKPEH